MSQMFQTFVRGYKSHEGFSIKVLLAIMAAVSSFQNNVAYRTVLALCKCRNNFLRLI